MVIKSAGGFVPIGESIRPITVDKLLIPLWEIKGLRGIGNEGKWGTVSVR